MFYNEIMVNAEHILKAHGLKNTGCRKHIVNELLTKGVALSEHEIKEVLPDLFDRVTFYRSLKTLEEKGIIHRIILHDASVKYALNDKLLYPEVHPHFHCTECDNVTCLDTDVKTNVSSLPPGYKVNETQVLYEGVCPKCLKKK